MDTILRGGEDKPGFNKVFIAGILVGLVVIAAAIYLLSLRPSMEEQTSAILQNAVREDSPQFADLSKDIIISTDERTVESPTGLGTISMFINGKIRNKGDKTIDILEVRVAVVTQFNQVLKERKILVVPVQQSTLDPGETIPITLTMDGFSKNDDRANIRWKVTGIHAK
jgi:hypothetical protein